MTQRGLQDCIKDSLEKYFSDLNGETSNGVFKMVTQQTESATIKFVLDKVNQNQSEAARILGINRATLKKKVSLYNL
ncbi:helix-turn-helix domain-containing protein [Candidatus Pseudothioglobus sp. Uisw_041]|jgi:Fis family transcriptional regulator|uniref:helix-turn-helix domain-containing protein n=1 Tax=unclassified Candidatus Pseudothioglobus TaxID=3072908 RepID=UPI0023324FBE|nr:Fis family transcriptional regulator [Candidatus Thioglobus sp.]MDB4038700.1 Fis family transcriptional regulator [Candidatus Thioglobus sp.]MDB4056737.1 Fis family transcriptional regulator [Candidatus Thioglobus sp.]MDB9865543.1 Fis family transcriptional regulator [Candidatus Thioglobus sp.]MDB9933704.1 Fis family transcriptional regulator [Candidatus Thioglobus sp.]|tara:strand:- start:1126 stop:1356 length:231 start_codon:yes stop_codon:yes gene_type:complete